MTTSIGASANSANDKFTYVFTPPPSIATLTPIWGPLAGGTAVTITGTNLSGITAVDFGSAAAALSSLVYNSNGTITVTSPASAEARPARWTSRL